MGSSVAAVVIVVVVTIAEIYFEVKIEKKYKYICTQRTISTSMKWISYQISTSYNELYLINSGISGRERERDKFCVINVKY